MSYFDSLNGFVDNVDAIQGQINTARDMAFSTNMGELEDKYQMIKDKALQAIPDELGDTLNYATQGITALSGTYNTMRALRKSKLGRTIEKKVTGKEPPQEPKGKEPAQPPEEPPSDVMGLPELDEIERRLNNVRNNPLMNPDEASERINEQLKGGAYDNLKAAVSKGEGNISSNSSYDRLQADRRARGEAPEQPSEAPRPAQAEIASDNLPKAQVLDPATGEEVKAPEPIKPAEKPSLEELGLDPISGFSPDEQKAIDTSNDPEKLRAQLQEEQALNMERPPEVPQKAPAPFEDLIPKAPQPSALTATEKAQQIARTTQQGGAAGGSELLAKIQGDLAEKIKPQTDPAAAGANAAEEAERAAAAAGRSTALLGAAELGAGGIAAGLEDIKGTGRAAVGARTSGEVINDGIAVKGGYNFGKRIVRFGKRIAGKKGDPDEVTEKPQSSQSVMEQHFDETDPEEPVRPQLKETGTEETEGSEAPTFEQQDLTIKITAPPEEEAGAAEPPAPEPPQPPRPPAPEPPEAQDPNIIQMTKPEFVGDEPEPAPAPKPDLPEPPTTQPAAPAPADVDEPASTASDVVESTQNIVQDTAEKGAKTLGQTILDTMGAESGTELALDSLGVVGEVAGLGLMLGGIFHDVFGRKKIEEQQQAAEEKAQQQEDAAQGALKLAAVQAPTTTAGIDLSSLHNIAGANASVGIV
jgi:hypothetical protein